MAESNLDWKKVFKKILLGDTESLSDSVNSSIEDACTLIPEEHSDREYIDKMTTKTSREFQNSNCGRVLSKTTGNSNEKAVESSSLNREVPAWNKVFKNILGANERPCSSKTTSVEFVQRSSDSYSQIHYSQRSSRKPAQPRFAPHKSKKQSEDESYLEKVLALSQMFKSADLNYKLNDFDGSGVNVFTSREPTANEYSYDDSKTYTNPHKISHISNKRIYLCPEDDSDDLHEPNGIHYTDISRPTGWVATKPYTYEDMISVKCITVSEVWDEDLWK